ncbi:hypothetical protein N7510_000237 [Penicillium lagena]|uniref:uncharacterized protein n=1 Tax=Penicillium lagena TaxID=94218 RepID=UPI002540C349|nr:uncharacterized protein N7510_000237 [Penicillium lagena]KAJ5623928.1 hypothetical protein N7510_000237 [Penicillium lagena]
MTSSAVKRGKAMETEGPTPKFLYAILKQLDLKSVDWNLVASQLEISNGHAARMRYSRFRQQMEGTTGARAAKVKKSAKRYPKGDLKAQMLNDTPPPPPPPTSGIFMKQEPLQPAPFVKWDPLAPNMPTLSDIPRASYSPSDDYSASPPPGMYCFPNSIPYSMAPAMPSMLSAADSPMPSTMIQYAKMPMRLMDTSMYEYGMPPGPNPGPTISFEPRPHSGMGWAPVKVERNNEDDSDAVIVKVEKSVNQNQ